MNTSEKEAFSYFSQTYHRLKTLNQPYRDKFDKYDEYYRGYREKTKYPFAYNYSMKKIIPVIYTILSRMMSHLYRTGGDVVVVKPRKSTNVRSAELAGGVLNYQLNNLNAIDFQGGSYMVMLQWILSCLAHGKGIVRAYWRKDEEIMPQRIMLNVPQFDTDNMGNTHMMGMQPRELMIEKPQIVYDGPYIENIPVRHWLPDPEYRSIQQMPCCAHIHTKSLDWLKKMHVAGVYKNVGELGEQAKTIKAGGKVDTAEFKMKLEEIEGAWTIDEIETDRHKGNNLDIIDLYGKYSLSGPIYDVNSKINYKGKEDEVICTIANYDTVIKLEKTKYGVKPFFDIGAHINMTRYWDIGVIELVGDILEAYDNIVNLRIQNSMMKVNTMIKVLIESDIDPAALTWKPFGVIPVDSMGDIEMFDSPDYNAQVFREQIDFFENVIQDITGIYGYTKGVTPSRQEHVGTIYSLQAVGEARIKLLMLTMDYMGFRPLLKYMMVLNMYNLPSGFEFRIGGRQGENQFARIFGPDLHIDYDFEAKYASMEPALAKEMRLQQLLQYAQIWQQDPSVNNYELKRAVFEMMDFPQPDRFLRDPREVAQMQEQAEMKAMIPKLGELASKEKIQTQKSQTEIVKALLTQTAGEKKEKK